MNVSAAMPTLSMSLLAIRTTSSRIGAACRAERFHAAVVAVLLLTPGCKPTAGDPPKSAPPLAGIAVKLAVVDDAALAHAISLARGQWQAETGSELTVARLTNEALAAAVAAGNFDADAVIYAPERLGLLVEKKLVVPIDRAALDDPELAWADIFELVKTREVSWGKSVYAVPFGSPVLECFYRADLLRDLGEEPPRTWVEYQRLAQLLEARGAVPPGSENKPRAVWRGAVEPAAPGWAALTLLARAAPYARHANHYSTLFNMQTMEPLIDAPPFVRALDEMVAAARVAPPPALDIGPAEAWSAIVAGNAGMALCWPVDSDRAAAATPNEPAEPVEIGCVALPGAAEVYNATGGNWERRDRPTSVPLLGIAGRVGSVTAQSSEPAAALRLLAWLTSRKGVERLASASAQIAPFRGAQVRSPQLAVRDGLGSGEAGQYVEAVAASLNAADCLVVLRIPGAERYLGALDDAVRKALAADGAASQAVLAEVADQWRAITAALGLDEQRAAYRLSLGLGP